jgi:hypothetical protein
MEISAEFDYVEQAKATFEAFRSPETGRKLQIPDHDDSDHLPKNDCLCQGSVNSVGFLLITPYTTM